jgi:dTDP-4-dehydrorhamnose 3,5-epimerase-like enzyme
MIKMKYKIETLPVTAEFLKEKRLIQERGELVLLADGEEIRHITFFSLNPGPEYFRGGHYHKKKTETFYIVSGKLRIFLADVENLKQDVMEVTAGQKIMIYPMCAHKFQAIEPSQVIEYYSTPYDGKDDIPFDNFDGEYEC